MQPFLTTLDFFSEPSLGDLDAVLGGWPASNVRPEAIAAQGTGPAERSNLGKRPRAEDELDCEEPYGAIDSEPEGSVPHPSSPTSATSSLPPVFGPLASWQSLRSVPPLSFSPDSAGSDAAASPVLKSCLKSAAKRVRSSAGARITFAEDTKANDGLRPATYLYDVLMAHCLRVGGVASCEELVKFLQVHASGYGDFRLFFDDVSAAVTDLSARLTASPGGVMIIAGGGGSNSRISCAAAPNVDHLLLALSETRKRMVASGAFPLLPPPVPETCAMHFRRSSVDVDAERGTPVPAA